MGKCSRRLRRETRGNKERRNSLGGRLEVTFSAPSRVTNLGRGRATIFKAITGVRPHGADMEQQSPTAVSDPCVCIVSARRRSAHARRTYRGLSPRRHMFAGGRMSEMDPWNASVRSGLPRRWTLVV